MLPEDRDHCGHGAGLCASVCVPNGTSLSDIAICDRTRPEPEMLGVR